MTDKINVKIKMFPSMTAHGQPTPATTKVFLRGHEDVLKGARPLEPGEIVALDKDEAMQLLAHCPLEVEMTLEDPTRPLFFRNRHEAEITSQFYNPSSAGRAEDAKKAMARMLEDAQNEDNTAVMDVINDLDDREAKIRAREIELGLREPEPGEDDELMGSIDKELDDYQASNNTLSDGELKNIRDAAAAEREAAGGAAPAPSTEATVPTTAPRRRRRRSAA